MRETIANKIGTLRAAKGITQEELASEVGVARQTIIAIEKGNYVPSLLLALKLAHFFKKPIESIFTITHEK